MFINPPQLKAQFNQEEALQEIAQISNQLPTAPNKGFKKQVKAFKKLIKTVPQDSLISLAVVHTKIGQAFAQKHHYLTAQTYFKEALNHRITKGDYKPIRWALNSLFDNSLAAKDFATASHCIKQWADLGSKQGDYGRKSHLLYRECVAKLKKLSLDRYRGKQITKEERQKHYASAEEAFIYLLKNHPKAHQAFFIKHDRVSIPFYQPIITYYLKEKNMGKAIVWEARAKETLRTYREGKNLANHLHQLAMLYRGHYKSEEIRLLQEYIDECQKLKFHDQVNLGYRDLAMLYHRSKEYRKAIQSFAAAIKYGHQAQQNENITKAYEGIDQILSKLVNDQNRSGWEFCKNWLDGFDSEGMPIDEVNRINDKINDLNFDDYVYINRNRQGEKVSEGRMINGVKEGKWTWYNGPTGKVEMTAYYKNGLKSGIRQIFFRSGKLNIESEFKADKLNGKHLVFYENGQIKQKAIYTNDKPNGSSYAYTETGTLVGHQEFKDGLLWNIILVTDKQGVPIDDLGNFRDGSGTLKLFDGDQAKLSATLTYQDGVLHGESIAYHANGKTRVRGSYFEGKQCGTWYTYDEEGNKLPEKIKVQQIECETGGINPNY